MSTNGDSHDDTAPSVRPGSGHDLSHEAGSVPGGQATAAQLLLTACAKIGLLEEDSRNAHEWRREMTIAVKGNERGNRTLQTALEAQGRTIEANQTETRGALEGIKATHAIVIAAVNPMLESRRFWGSVLGVATKVGAALALLSAFAGGVLKIYETLKGH